MTIASPLGDLGERPAADARRTIPFDYAFRYRLEGKPANVLNGTVTVSIESTFVAVSIGYGAVPKLTPVTLGVGRGAVVRNVLKADLEGIALSIRKSLVETGRRMRGDTIFGAVLRNGIRLNPQFADVALSAIERGGPLDARIADRLFQVVSPPPEQIQFLYALYDEGSGREFQSEPILNTAGLGISNGDRPFRYFPKPIVFAPRTTIRLQITEVSDFEGDLHVSLQGYKVLGQAGTPTALTRRRFQRRRGAA